jgi:hypothetical protein
MKDAGLTLAKQHDQFASAHHEMVNLLEKIIVDVKNTKTKVRLTSRARNTFLYVLKYTCIDI